MRWAAMLRAINVGGRKLPMGDLRAFAATLGLEEPRTLLASGNLVFGSSETDAAALEQWLEEEVAGHFGLRTEFLLRSANDLRAVIAANPFIDAADARPSRLLVHFHREPIPADYVGALEADNKGSERLAAKGRELYVDYTDGVGVSTLDRVMKLARHRRLNTARNWNTVGKLLAML